MKGMTVIFLMLLLVMACSDKPGSGILEEKKMMNVMWDLMQADEFANTYISKDSSLDLKKERFKLYQDVYRINELGEKTFSESYKYYTGHPDLMKKIFDSLTTKGERERQSLYQPPDTATAKKTIVVDSTKRDSIKSAFLFRDSVRIDSMRKVINAKEAKKRKSLMKDSLPKKTEAQKRAGAKRVPKQ